MAKEATMRYLLIVLMLAGCATQPRRTIYDAAADECDNYGFTQGTDSYANCMRQEVADRKALIGRVLLGR